jgi:hypothetical protein
MERREKMKIKSPKCLQLYRYQPLASVVEKSISFSLCQLRNIDRGDSIRAGKAGGLGGTCQLSRTMTPSSKFMSRHSDVLHVEQIHPIHGTAIRSISSTVMAWKTPRTIVEGSGQRHFLVDSLVALGSALLLLAWLLRHNRTPCLRTLEESREVANPRSNRLFAAMEKIERRLFQSHSMVLS